MYRLILGKNGGWRSYRATTGNWHQIWVWFEGNYKGLRVQTEILASVFEWISKQQLNLLLFLSDWYCRKLRKLEKASAKKMIFMSHQKCKEENRDYGSHFSVIFERARIFLIVFARLILVKVKVDGFTGPLRESDVR